MKYGTPKTYVLNGAPYSILCMCEMAHRTAHLCVMYETVHHTTHLCVTYGIALHTTRVLGLYLGNISLEHPTAWADLLIVI